jgi:FkbM family methyltransferase
MGKLNLIGIRLRVNQILEKFGLHLMYENKFRELINQGYDEMCKWSSIGTLQLALKNPDKFDEVYHKLTDENSKSTFDLFVKYRLAYAFLGEYAAKIYPPMITKEDLLIKMNDLEINLRNGLIKMQNFIFKSSPFLITQTWMFEQYALERSCEVSQGDFVIDGGSFMGETAFWFLSKGASKVYAFEPDPLNFKVLSENIKRNNMSERIIPIQQILLDKQDRVNISSTGTSMSITLGGGNTVVKSLTLDSFVERQKLERVDFIKLDVEGAELSILKGALETIKKFKPKMAISIYHKPEDIITIPLFLFNVLPQAKFYLSHKFYNWCETVLFVNPRG